VRYQLIAAVQELLADDGADWDNIVVDAVKQTDDPNACLRQTWRFVIAQARRWEAAGCVGEDPNIAWMHARCEACDLCCLRP
jgi:hypothetical protein